MTSSLKFIPSPFSLLQNENNTLKVSHLWGDYSPDLFDKSHPLCLSHGLESRVLCRSFIESGAVPLPNTFSIRKLTPEVHNSMTLRGRILRFVRRPIDSYLFSRLVIDMERAFDADILHIHFGTTGAELLKWGGLPKKPLVVSFYGYDASAALRNPAILKRYSQMFARHAVVHVLSNAVADRMVAHGCRRERIVVGNLPANVESIPHLPGEKTEFTRYLIAARFVEKKGHAVLLTAFKQLVATTRDVRLTCFGYGSSTWLRSLISNMNLDDYVDVIDNGQTGSFVERYIDLLRQHDVVVAPSIQSSSGDDEGGPALTLVMAQAAGKPVIVSDFPGAERSVTDRVEGIVVASDDAQLLFNAMREMKEDALRWERFGAAGRLRVLAEFSEHDYWRNLEKWYLLALEKTV